MVGEWCSEVQVDRDLDTSGMIQDVHEVMHNDKECYQISIGEMNDSNLMRNHISKKIIDRQSYTTLKESKYFTVDPLCAWDMRQENIKVKKARNRYYQMVENGDGDDFFGSESLKDIVNFYALDKYRVSSVLVEKSNCKPHIVNRDAAMRLVFECYDGSFIQVEQDMELIVFMWDKKKKREDYFYREVGKFKDTCGKLFKGIISNLMKMRNRSLNFIPSTPIVNNRI